MFGTRSVRVRRVAAFCVLAAPFVLAPVAGSVNGNASERAVCPGAPAAAARCNAHVVTDQRGNPFATTAPTGYGPVQFHTAYGLPTTAGSVQTIAIVDAYDSPTIESDLAVYSSTYGLPACTSGNGCFRKVNQAGNSGPYP